MTPCLLVIGHKKLQVKSPCQIQPPGWVYADNPLSSGVGGSGRAASGIRTVETGKVCGLFGTDAGFCVEIGDAAVLSRVWLVDEAKRESRANLARACALLGKDSMNLRLVTGDTRSALDPIPFPVNAVRALGQPKAARQPAESKATAGRISPSWWGREHNEGAADALDSIANVHEAMARVDATMSELTEDVERVLASPFLTRDDDGPRAA